MNLLYTITAYPPSLGGGQLHQHYLARQLAPHHHIRVVTHWRTNRRDWLLGTTLRAPAVAEDYAIDGIDVHRIGITPTEKRFLLPFVLAYYPLMGLTLPPVARLIETKLKPFAASADLIHNVRIGREGLSYASLQAARTHDIPFVFTPLHHPRWVGWRYRAYLDLYQQADAVIALTESEKRTLVELGVQEDRVTVLGHGPVLADDAYPESFRQKHGIEGPVVLFVGQHYEYKGYLHLLRAMPLVWSRLPEAEFVFIGPPKGDSERAFEQHADPRLHRLGIVSLQEKTDALAACTLLALPSTQESFGGVFTEAWHFAKPVIGCRIPAVAEVISAGEDGCLVEQEPGAIAEAVLDLLYHSSRAAAMGRAGQQKVAARYSWDRLARRIEAVYGSVTK